jgi:hypothetical protein
MSRQKPLLLSTAKQVLLLIDWDNLFFSLVNRFGKVEYIRIETRLKILIDWIKEEIGELVGKYGFVFAPEHLSLFHQEICINCGLKLITCPKRQLNNIGAQEDTVDETIIWFAKMMTGHFDFKTICLVSGDNHFVPLLEELKEQGIKIALAPPTADSLARTKELIDLVDINLQTGKRMLLMLDGIAV